MLPRNFPHPGLDPARNARVRQQRLAVADASIRYHAPARYDDRIRVETTLDITATLFPRRTVPSVGLAPLTSMYFVGENDREQPDPFRPEVHDSDGLMVATGNGEWIWRPLLNPKHPLTTSFSMKDLRGYQKSAKKAVKRAKKKMPF